MSLLMEALRKAEKAKSKTEHGGIGEPNAKNLPVEPLGIDNNSAPTTKRIDFESQPISLKETSLDDLEFLSVDDSNSLLETHIEEADEATEALPFATPSEADDINVEDTVFEETSAGSQEPHQRNSLEINNKQAINSLFQAKVATQRKQKRKYRVAAASIILLLGVCGELYWYLGASEPQYIYPTVANQNTNRGLLREPAQAEEDPGNTTLTPPIDFELDAVPFDEDAEPAWVTASVFIEEQEALIANEPFSLPAVVQEEQSLKNSDLGLAIVEVPLQERMTISFKRTKINTELNPQVSAAYSKFQSGDFDDAFTQYQAVLSSQQNDRDAMLGLASIYIKRGEAVLAQNMYSRILKLNPKDPLAQAGLLSNSLPSDPIRQELELKALIASYPDVAPLSFALGNLYASQNRWNKAQTAYFDASVSAKASNNGPISPDYAFNLAVSLEQLNQLQPAYTFYQEALELSRLSTSGFEQELLLSRILYLEQVL